MTEVGDISIANKAKIKSRTIIGSLIAISMLTLVLFLSLFASSKISELAYEGMMLAVKSVLPISLPFMVLSDIYVKFGHPERIGGLNFITEKLFCLPSAALTPLVTGNVAGFPIGAIGTAELYKEKALDKASAERLLALSSNPSASFVIGGVGLGMYGDMRYGIILLLSIYTSTVICGVLSREKRAKYDISNDINRQKYNFVSSVKNAGISSVSMISFISLFSVVIGLIKLYIKSDAAVYSLSLFLEITNAVNIFSSLFSKSATLSLALSGFALGFGGVSVMLQSAVFTQGTDLSFNKCIKLKFVEGLMTATLSVIGYYLINMQIL